MRNQPHRGNNGVFNGSTGTITAIDPEAHQLTVTLTDGESIPYPFADLDELLHAYALTVHRSQGSEYPYVVIPLTASAGQLLQRNLLYTAVTRASRGVVLTGQATAVHRALQHPHPTPVHRTRTPHPPANRSHPPAARHPRSGTTCLELGVRICARPNPRPAPGRGRYRLGRLSHLRRMTPGRLRRAQWYPQRTARRPVAGWFQCRSTRCLR
ncbi:ATP-binding domain-containing protein [Streptomyces antimycoticus]